jgi:hypothetical protein
MGCGRGPSFIGSASLLTKFIFELALMPQVIVEKGFAHKKGRIF